MPLNLTENKPRYIYIMLSRTSTALAKAIQLGGQCQYNHCSIGFDDDVSQFYSFGRKRVLVFWDGGFVHEGRDFGFFKVYKNSQITVLRVEVSQYQYNRAKASIAEFERSNGYHSFNILGLAFAVVGIPFGADSRYFCSQFVSEVLTISGITDFHKDSRLVRPEDMLSIEGYTVVYSGAIKDYAIPQPVFPTTVIA